MQFINYLLAGLLSFFGLIFGIILVLIAPEEQKPGRKYFILLQELFFISAVILFLISREICFANFCVPEIPLEFLSILKIDILFIFLIITLFIIFILKIKIKDNFRKSELMYLILAIIFFLSFKNLDLFLIESALIFLFGMAAGSLLFDRKRRNYYNVVFRNIIFLAAALFLFSIAYFV